VTGRAFALELVELERVAGRGTERTAWFVRTGDAWTKVDGWPGATVERRDAGPGTVWEHAVGIAVPAGTELMRVDSRPRAAPPKDPLAHLRSGAARPPRATRRSYFRVDTSGRLVAVTPTGRPGRSAR
jgi:hypothetical protein